MSEKFWDKMASVYDNAERVDTPVNLKIMEKTRHYLAGDDVVLDVGCGTGLFANELAGNVKIIHAIDISSKMVEIARKNADDRNIANVKYLQATLFDEKLGKSSFDVVMAFYIIHLLEDADLALQRICDLLKPGGLFISVTPCMGDKPFQSFLLSLTGRIGLTPKIRGFKANQLIDLVGQRFEILETECIKREGQQYFIAARKKA